LFAIIVLLIFFITLHYSNLLQKYMVPLILFDK